MGFWSPRAFCPACGAKIHTHGALGESVSTGKVCPSCGVALPGRINFRKQAELAEAPATSPKQVATGEGPSMESAGRTTLLKKLVELRDTGMLTQDEFERESDQSSDRRLQTQGVRPSL